MQSSLYRLPVLLISLALLTSCQESDKAEKTVTTPKIEKSENVIQALTPRTVALTSKSLLKKPYLSDVLPDSAYVYARIPNIWSFAGGAVGNIFDKALGSKPYSDALNSVKKGFGKEVIPELPKEAKELAELLLLHMTSPIEVAAITPLLGKKSPFPNVLLTVAVDFKDIESANQLLVALVERSPVVTLEKTIQSDGMGEIKINGLRAQIKFDLATHRIFILGGMKLQDASLIEFLKVLKPNSAHAMKIFESDIDSSGQGSFVWVDPQKLLGLANALGAQKQLAPLAMFGLNSIKNIAFGAGTSKGINHFKFILDMPKTGFRGFIPTIQNAPSFKLAGNTDFIMTLGLPNKTDFISIESSIAAMSPSDKMQKYYDVKKIFAKNIGFEIEDIFEILGQDISLASDESGMYTAIRLNDAKKFNEVLATIVKKYHLNHEIRTISGQEYHHLKIPSLEKLTVAKNENISEVKLPKERQLINRFMMSSTHLYWQEDAGYLIMASIPQTLMDRHYSPVQKPANEWLEKEQRMDPKGALLMATMRNKGVPASMYRTRLAILNYLGDVVDRPVDMFALPTVREADLPKDGAYGLKLASTENQLSLELSFESNPAEVLFAGNSYAGIMMAGVLASIAMPAFEDYKIKAQVLSGLANAYAVKGQLDLFKLENDHYPMAEEIATLNQSKWNKKDYQISIDPNNGNIVVGFKHRRLSSDLVLVKPKESGVKWECISDISAKFLPVGCR